MNISKMLVIGFWVISGCVEANSTMAVDMPRGIIKLAENSDGSGKSCTLDIQETSAAQYFPMRDTSCGNDNATFFKLENVPSATQIRFDGAPCHFGNHEWYFRVKTIIHPTETIWVNLEDLRGLPLLSVVVKGVLLETRNKPDNYSKGKLSCVVVWRSELP